MTTRNILTRAYVRKRAEAASNVPAWYEQLLTDFRSALADAQTDEERTIGVALVAVAESHVAHARAIAEAYARIASGGKAS